MSYGDPLSTTIPAVGAAGTSYASDINARLTEIETVLESDVPYSSLTGPELDLNNVPLVGAEYVELLGMVAVDTSLVGTLQRYSNDLYWVTDEGAVRITLNGNLDASSIGGIGGNYGGGNPALVSFTDSTSVYNFYDDAGTFTWAYTRCRGVDIADGAATTDYVKLRAPAISASYTLTFPAALPGSNRSVLVVDSSGQIEDNDGTNTITNDIVLGTGVKIQHDTKTKHLPLFPDIVQGSSFTWNTGVIGVLVAGGAITCYWHLPVEEGQKLTGASAFIGKTSASAATLKVFKTLNSTGVITQIGSTATDSTSGANVTLAVTGLTQVIGSGETYFIELVIPSNTDSLRAAKFTYRQDA